MFNNNKGESFVGIIVGVFILGFVILGITNLLVFTIDSSKGFRVESRERNIERNAKKILNQSNLSSLSVGDDFYIYKNTSTKEFEILTGPTNTGYQYVDYLGNHITDINNYDGTIYILKGKILEKNTFFAEEDIIYEVYADIYNL